MAQHMFALYGKQGEKLLWSKDMASSAPSCSTPSCKPLVKTSSAPVMPVGGTAPRMLDPHAPSLSSCAIGMRARSGSDVPGHAHQRIGGAADHHVTPWPHLQPGLGWGGKAPAEAPGELWPPSRRRSASFRSVASGPAGFGPGPWPGPAAASSWRSSGTVLSAASSVLLKSEAPPASARLFAWKDAEPQNHVQGICVQGSLRGASRILLAVL